MSRGDTVVEFHCEDLSVGNIKYHLRTPHSKSDRVAVFLPRWPDISDLFERWTLGADEDMFHEMWGGSSDHQNL